MLGCRKRLGVTSLLCVCGYINVCRDLRWEAGLCSSASGGQIGSDRQNQASLLWTWLQNLHFSICSAVTYSPPVHLIPQSVFPPVLPPPLPAVRIFCTLYSSASYVLLYISRSRAGLCEPSPVRLVLMTSFAINVVSLHQRRCFGFMQISRVRTEVMFQSTRESRKPEDRCCLWALD